MIKIVTDSTCDLPPGYFEENDISIVPINIQFGTETYRDGIDIDREAFYQRIDDLGMLPTTSQPSSGQFEEHYRRLAAEGADDIISLHVTAKLSGTYQSAELARGMVADQVRIHPFDSACGSAGLGFMVLEAARLARAGVSVNEILVRLALIRERMNLVLSIKDMRFAQMSGRVGRLQGSLAALLNVKPIVLLQDGVIDVVEKVRSQSRAISRLIKMVSEQVGSEPVNLAVIHADAPDEGQALMGQTAHYFTLRESFLVNLTTSLVVHFGPGTLGLVAYRV
ncbi:MAG: DegV family protein [Anaerolineae bacterium]|nr:DegV family protein [Anaerolineae bacterium]